MRRIMKFGGTSVANADVVCKAAEIIKQYHDAGDELVVVVSAQRGVTDAIMKTASELLHRYDEKGISELLADLSTRHLTALKGAAPSHYEEVRIVIEHRIENLGNLLRAIYYLKELTPRSYDYVSSFGERLNVPIISACLCEMGVPSTALDACQAGVLTTRSHGDAVALPAGEERIRDHLLPLITGKGGKTGENPIVPVITGFMGCTEDGAVTTLGRGGSDYSASIIGAALDADEIWIWTDVDGIMTTDPRLVENARVIEELSYIEVMELSYFGAKVMHSRSIEPAMQKSIPVFVKNTFHPDALGTVISAGNHRDTRVVKAITYIEKVATVTVAGAQMIGRPGVAKFIFSSLAEAQVNVMMISQGSSEANITIVIDEDQAERAKECLFPLTQQCMVREVLVDRNVCAVAVVGSGMSGAHGTAGRTFSALGSAGINVMMISQGSSEVNISFVVQGDQGAHAVHVLHEEFELAHAEGEIR
ncbi:MAG: aspartate kinase [Methanomicrobiales archaeon]|nr:aspartate kinase [Methanomicrobiales archaeon]